ncbi:MAG: hypothetical protein LAT54_05955 [Cryomorphaceae bacterium]|nr:hypothetical protein [Cryomorphaceae bacterium]
MSKIVPLFPLELFLLPGEFYQLHIFEPRYKQLVKDVMNNDREFGIPFFHITNGRNLGCWVEIIDVYNENELGECDIAIRCKSLMIVKSFLQKISDEITYPGGEINVWNNHWNQPVSEKLLSDFKDYLSNNNMKNSQWIKKKNPGVIDVFTMFNPNAQDKLSFITLKEVEQREKFVQSYVRYYLLLDEQESHQYHNIYLN